MNPKRGVLRTIWLTLAVLTARENVRAEILCRAFGADSPASESAPAAVAGSPLDVSIDDLSLLPTTVDFLRLRFVRRVGHLVRLTEADFSKRSYARRTLQDVSKALAAHGLTLGAPDTGWREFPLESVLERPLSDFYVSIPLQLLMEQMQRTRTPFRRIGDLARLGEAEFLALHAHPKALSEAIRFLASFSLRLGDARGWRSIAEALPDIPTYSFLFSPRTVGILRRARIESARELIRMSEAEFLRLPYGNPESLNQAKEFLAGLGLRFGMSASEIDNIDGAAF